MFNINDLIEHPEYGRGKIISYSKNKETILVCFEKDFEVITGEIIDEDFYFEDNRRLERTNFIEVFPYQIKKVILKSNSREPYCYNCKKILSSNTHSICKKCNWIICDCESCGCNYKK